ncbi:MAG: hypothetical protein ACYTFY_08185 [Planctomycetota bacterium]|jgi:hypothetical protein
MRIPKTYYKEKPRLFWVIVFIIPALAGCLGFFAGLYLVFAKDETGLGLTMAVLAGVSGLGFGWYVLDSIGPYLNSEKYFLRLEENQIIFSKGKIAIVIPAENLIKARGDVVKQSYPNLPAVYWTNVEYSIDGKTQIERFTNGEYGGHKFAEIITRKYKSCQES